MKHTRRASYTSPLWVLVAAALAGLTTLILRVTAFVWGPTDCVTYPGGCSSSDGAIWPIIDATTYVAYGLLLLSILLAAIRLRGGTSR